MGAASFLLGLKDLLSGDAQAKITAFEKDGDALHVTFELRREGEAMDLSSANADYVKAIVRCAEDLGFVAEIEAEKPAVTQTGAVWTVELKLPSGQAAAFVRIEIK